MAESTKKTSAKKATAARSGESRSERARRLGPTTTDHIKQKKPRGRTVYIPLDDELAERVEHLSAKLQDAKVTLAKVRGTRGADATEAERELAGLEAELDKAKGELDENMLVLKFRAMGRRKYEKLLEEHPPSKEDIAEAKKNGDKKPVYDGETFGPALVGASCYEPDLSEGSYFDEDEERTRYPLAEEIFDEWNQGELTALFMAAFEVNNHRRQVETGNV